METNWEEEFIKLTDSALQLNNKYKQTRYILDKVKEYLETYFNYDRKTEECSKRYDFDSSNAKFLIKMIDRGV